MPTVYTTPKPFMFPDFSHPILAIDTSTNYLSIALHTNNQQLLYHEDVGPKQSELILPHIRRLMNEADIKISDLGAIVYAQGPGAFTGLRVGTGIAQGLATPFHIPLIGIPCLDAVAYQIKGECILAATDARMGEVFYAWFDTCTQKRLSDYQVGKATAITLPENATNPQGIGNAFSLAEPPPLNGKSDMPTAADYLALAKTQRYPTTDTAHAELLYVRNKIALTAKEQAARKGL